MVGISIYSSLCRVARFLVSYVKGAKVGEEKRGILVGFYKGFTESVFSTALV